MKLQKQVSRRIGKTEYVKWVVVLPTDRVQETGWKNGEELEADKTDGGLLIRKRLSANKARK